MFDFLIKGKKIISFKKTSKILSKVEITTNLFSSFSLIIFTLAVLNLSLKLRILRKLIALPINYINRIDFFINFIDD
jgi:hypothetical protein